MATPAPRKEKLIVLVGVKDELLDDHSFDLSGYVSQTAEREASAKIAEAIAQGRIQRPEDVKVVVKVFRESMRDMLLESNY